MSQGSCSYVNKFFWDTCTFTVHLTGYSLSFEIEKGYHDPNRILILPYPSDDGIGETSATQAASLTAVA